MTTRFMFDSIEAATNGLVFTLLHARTTANRYTITGLDAQTLLSSGMVLSGEISDITQKLAKQPGVVYYDE